MPEYSFFRDIKSLNMQNVTIKTGADHGQTILNVDPYNNYGQHAAGSGRINNIDEGTRAASAQDIDHPPNMVPDPMPIRKRFKSAPVVIKTPQPPLQPLPQTDIALEVKPEVKATKDSPDVQDTNDSFAGLWKEALAKYKEQTGVDIQDPRNEFVQLFDDCNDSNDGLAVLGNLPVFKKPGAQRTWMKIKESLKRLLDVVIVLNGLAGLAGDVVLPHFGKMIFVGTGLLLRASKDVAKQGEALEKLFSRLADFLCRLEVRGRGEIQPSSRRIIVKILVELLNALAIATAMTKAKFWNKVKTLSKKVFFDEDEIEKSLSRLADLTEAESAMMLAELATSRPDFTDFVRQLGGLDANVKVLALQIRSVIERGKLGNNELNELSSLLRSNDKAEVLQLLQLLKSLLENDGAESTLKHIDTELQELKKSLARDRDRGSANGQAVHETSENSGSASGRMQDTYAAYDNYGQHVTGGDVEIRNPQTTASPVNSNSRPALPIPMLGSGRDTYGHYSNFGQHVTGGKVLITSPTTNLRQ